MDNADLALIGGFAWRRIGNGYVQAQRSKLYVYMHRLIAGAGPDELVDHMNGDRLDNRMCNLRIATSSQNGANRTGDRRKLGTSSGYKGVSWDKQRRKWVASIHIHGKTVALGRYEVEADAARAYNDKALATWGEFARLNEVEEGSRSVGR